MIRFSFARAAACMLAGVLRRLTWCSPKRPSSPHAFPLLVIFWASDPLTRERQVLPCRVSPTRLPSGRVYRDLRVTARLPWDFETPFASIHT